MYSVTDNENISRERAASILVKLLLLTSVETIEAIQDQEYLTKQEIYSGEELDKIKATSI